MPKRKIEAEVAVSVTGADKVEKLEKQIDALTDTEIAIDADTSDAQSALQRFEGELDELNLESGRELRIEFRAELLQQEVRNALRTLERLEDPVEIRTQTTRLEEAQRELRDLAELAERKYSVQIEIDPRRNARRAADDVDLMRQRGEGLQSALPALRGFTDEMGATAQKAGIAGQALGDLGDFSLILGEKFGLSTKATAALGTALGAAGLATVIVGFALPAIQQLIEGQEGLDEKTRAASDAIAEQSGAVDALAEAIKRATTGDPLVTAILGQFGDDEEQLDKITDALARLGIQIDGGLGEALRRLRGEDSRVPILEQMSLLADRSVEDLERIDEALRRTSGYNEFFNRLVAINPELGRFVAANRTAFEDLARLDDAANEIDLGAAYADALLEIQKTTQGVELLAQAQANVGGDAGIGELLAEYERLRAELVETEGSVEAVATTVREAAGDWDDFRFAAEEALGAVLRGATDAVASLDPVTKKLQEITGRVDEEQTILALVDQFDSVADAAERWAKSVEENSEDVADNLRAYRREQLKLTEDVVAYLETLEDIPLSKVTEIDALLDKGKLVEAQRLIEELTGDKFSTLFVDIVPRGGSNGFNSLTFGISGDAAPIQGRTDYGAATFVSQPITIINPPGTPAATTSTIDLYTLRNGDRNGAV
jgi:hypothetical protein